MIRFIKEIDKDNEFSNSSVEFTIHYSDVTVTELLEEFECFLKACGYVFDGHVDIVKDALDEEI